MEMTKQEVREWCGRVGYPVEEYVLSSQGGRFCDVCGEPLAAGSEGIGEFVLTGMPATALFNEMSVGDHFIAHAQCGMGMNEAVQA